jgi:hypothetical protein
VIPVKFELKPEDQGIRQYKLRVRPFEGEAEKRDNEKTAKVEIIDRRTKVLLIAGGPMRDFIFLRNQLYRDKEIVSDVWLQSGKPGISQEAHELLYKFPETEDELFDYDSIVAFDPDWEQLSAEQVMLLERWVAEKAGGLVIVTGPVFTPQWSSRRRGDPRIDTLKALYPVVFYYQGSATLSLGRFGSEKSWPLVFTDDGKQAEFLWLDDSAEASDRAWGQFDGVCGYYAVKDTKRFSAGQNIVSHFGLGQRVFTQLIGKGIELRIFDDKEPVVERKRTRSRKNLPADTIKVPFDFRISVEFKKFFGFAPEFTANLDFFIFTGRTDRGEHR